MPAIKAPKSSQEILALDWFSKTVDMTISYGSIRPTSPTGDILQLQGNYDAINIAGYNFAIKYNKPVFADRLTYSLGLIEAPQDVQLACDGSTVTIRRKKEIAQKIAGLVLRMDSDSKETNKITYCKHQGQKILWINFNFPQQLQQQDHAKENDKNIFLNIVQ